MEEALKEKVLTYQLLEVRLRALLQQMDLILKKVREIRGTIESLKEFGKEEEFLSNLGSECFIKTKVLEKKVIVEIGARTYLEKSLEEAKAYLEKKQKFFETSLKSFEKEITKNSELLRYLQNEIARIVQTKK